MPKAKPPQEVMKIEAAGDLFVVKKGRQVLVKELTEGEARDYVAQAQKDWEAAQPGAQPPAPPPEPAKPHGDAKTVRMRMEDGTPTLGVAGKVYKAGKDGTFMARVEDLDVLRQSGCTGV